MRAWTPTDRRVGMWSAWAVVVLWLAYVCTGGAWLLFGGEPVRRDPGTPVDPFRAILEILMVLVALATTVLMAALQASAPPGVKTCSVAALAFMVLAAGTTCGIHFVELTVVRRIEPANPSERSVIFFTHWPSVFFALDLLAWDLFLGLSLLFAGATFKGGGLQAGVRVALIVSGTFCVAGILGPALGDLRFQFLGIIGYAAVFPVGCLLLAILLGRAEPSAEADPARGESEEPTRNGGGGPGR